MRALFRRPSRDLPDIEAPAADAGRIGFLLENYGLALIRGLVTSADCRRWNDAMHSNAEILERLPGYISTAAVPSSNVAFCAEHPDPAEFLARLSAAKETGDIFPVEFTPEEVRQVTGPFLKRFESLGLFDVFRRFLGSPSPCFHMAYSNSRYLPPEMGYSRATHQDARLQNRRDLFLTFWTPFVRCGPGIAPSLSVVPKRLHDYAPWLPSLSMADDAMPEKEWANPVYEPGDVLVHSGFTIHRTYSTPRSRGWRTSMDLRYFERSA